MEYRDRAVAAVRAAEHTLRKEIGVILVEAINVEAWVDVAAIARMAEALSDLLRQVSSGNYGIDPEPKPTLEELFADRPSSSRTTREAHATTSQKLLSRGSSRREQYPQFLRDGDRLVKVAWSKKERRPYEHRAPQVVIQTLIDAIRKRKGEGKQFEAADILPLMTKAGEEYPSYQSYLALSWLRHVGIVTKMGREGYVLKTGAASPDKVNRLWASLPTED